MGAAPRALRRRGDRAAARRARRSSSSPATARAGDRLVLTTATNRFLTAPIAARLGIADLIATDLEVGAARRVHRAHLGHVNMREGKVARLAAWLPRARARWIEPCGGDLYSDSINDLPLLCAVGAPSSSIPIPAFAPRRCAEAGR